MCGFFFVVVVVFWWDLGLNSGLHACEAGALLLESIFALVIWRWVFLNFRPAGLELLSSLSQTPQ
jgi:hypothetical protein